MVVLSLVGPAPLYRDSTMDRESSATGFGALAWIREIAPTLSQCRSKRSGSDIEKHYCIANFFSVQVLDASEGRSAPEEAGARGRLPP